MFGLGFIKFDAFRFTRNRKLKFKAEMKSHLQVSSKEHFNGLFHYR